MKNSFIKSIALSVVVAVSALQAEAPKSAEHNASGEKSHHKHFGYIGNVAPAHWGELNPKFKMCSEGKQQSPINIIPTKKGNLSPLDISYKTASKSIINNGHSIQVNIEDGSVLKLDGKDFKLKQFHFHVPSENNINGNKFPLEAHFVNVADDGQIAVIGVMFKYGKENPTLAKIWNELPSLKEGEAKEFKLGSEDINKLLPKEREYYKFMGSLTTPPCSQNVKWQIFKTPLEVSKEQIDKFFSQFSFPNNRPIQPTNDRDILE